MPLHGYDASIGHLPIRYRSGGIQPASPPFPSRTSVTRAHPMNRGITTPPTNDATYTLPHFFQEPHRPPGGLPVPGRLLQSVRAVSALTANGAPPRNSTLRFPFQKRHVAQICISHRNDVVPMCYLTIVTKAGSRPLRPSSQMPP